MYYFLSGYTAKVAGTERGVKEPQATFSSCFGAVFLVWHPTKYAEMLGRLIDEHGSDVWLVNTGWTGGAYGVGKRMKLAHTRAMVHALLRGDCTRRRMETDPVFGLRCRRHVAGVPDDVLKPAHDVAGQGGLRRAGEKAGGDVPRELREVREVRSDVGEERGSEVAGVPFWKLRAVRRSERD